MTDSMSYLMSDVRKIRVPDSSEEIALFLHIEASRALDALRAKAVRLGGRTALRRAPLMAYRECRVLLQDTVSWVRRKEGVQPPSVRMVAEAVLEVMERGRADLLAGYRRPEDVLFSALIKAASRMMLLPRKALKWLAESNPPASSWRVLERVIDEKSVSVHLQWVEEKSRLAFEEVWVRNIPLVISVAVKRQRPTMELADLIQDGCLGLYMAIERFELSRGTKFSTFAIPWIVQRIQRGVLKTAYGFRMPDRFYGVVRAVEEVALELRMTGVEPSDSEILKALKRRGRRAIGMAVTMENLQAAKRFLQPFQSLDELVGDPESGKERKVDRYVPFTGLGLEEIVEEAEMSSRIREVIQGAVGLLSGWERVVIVRRYGLSGGAPESLERIGMSLGLSKERVRQIEKRALRKIGDVLRGLGLNPLQGGEKNEAGWSVRTCGPDRPAPERNWVRNGGGRKTPDFRRMGGSGR